MYAFHFSIRNFDLAIGLRMVQRWTLPHQGFYHSVANLCPLITKMIAFGTPNLEKILETRNPETEEVQLVLVGISSTHFET